MSPERFKNIFEVVNKRGYTDGFVARGQIPVDKIVQDPLGAWMTEVGMIDLLTPEEEKVAIKAVKYGKNEEERKMAHDLLVIANQRLVMSIAFRYLTKRSGIEDLIQEGNLGLLRAINTYDPNRGRQFSTHAYESISKYVMRYREGSMRIPQYLPERMALINKAKDSIRGTRDMEPLVEEIARSLLSKYQDMWWVRHITGTEAVRVSKLSRLIVKYEKLWERGFSVPLDDQIPSRKHPTNKQAEDNIISNILDAELRNLPPREKQVIDFYFGFKGSVPMSLEEVGKKLGVTRERIRQLINQAKERLVKNPTVRALW